MFAKDRKLVHPSIVSFTSPIQGRWGGGVHPSYHSYAGHQFIFSSVTRNSLKLLKGIDHTWK